MPRTVKSQMSSAYFNLSRQRLGYTTEDVAEELGVGVRAVAAWYTSRRPSQKAATWIERENRRYVHNLVHAVEAMEDLHRAGLPVELVRYPTEVRIKQTAAGFKKPHHCDAFLRDLSTLLLINEVPHTIITETLED